MQGAVGAVQQISRSQRAQDGTNLWPPPPGLHLPAAGPELTQNGGERSKEEEGREEERRRDWEGSRKRD